MSHSDRLATAIGSEALVLPADGPIMMLRAAPGPALDLIGRDRLICEQGFRPVHDALADAGFRTETQAPGPASAVIVSLTRARAENLGNIARGLEMLAPGGLLAVAGAKTEGVDSLLAHVGRAFAIDGQISKAHGRVFWLNRPDALPAVVADWAEADRPRRNADGFVTAPGMFSPDGIDPGSRRLAEALPAKLRGRVADFGAGWGWLAIQALSRAPEISQVDLYEAELRALDAARANLTDPRAGFHWVMSPGWRGMRRHYDAILANPPFHRWPRGGPDARRGFHRRRRPGAEVRQLPDGRQPPAALRSGARRPFPALGTAVRGSVLQGHRRHPSPPRRLNSGAGARPLPRKPSARVARESFGGFRACWRRRLQVSKPV